MIQARHTAFYVRFFNFYSRLMIRSHFRRVRIIGNINADFMPVLMIGNHFSWWDGFFACYINQMILKKKFHIMMLEEQLRPRMFLNKAGAFSIRRGSRDALESLQYAAGLLSLPENLVVLYPQGEFESLYRYPVKFEKGIEKVSAMAGSSFEVVFYAALMDYFSYRKPSLSIYLKQVSHELSKSSVALEKAYNDFLNDCRSHQKPE